MNIEESASNYVPNENEDIKIDEKNSEIPKGCTPKNTIFSMLKSETGEGTIQSYDNHPLNIKSNNYVSQIIRGMTGILGSLNFAIVDIILGALGFVKEKKESNITYEVVDEKKDEPTIVHGQHV